MDTGTPQTAAFDPAPSAGLRRLRAPAAVGLSLLLFAVLLARVVFGVGTGLAGDEAYYWEWSRHLAWGYFDHPPMIAYLVAAGVHAAGDTTLGVRLLPIVLSVAAIGMVYRTAVLYSGRTEAGWWAAFLLSVVPLFAVGAPLATPDAPLVFFWALAVWLVCEGLRGDARWPWLAAGLAVGCAMLSKYTGAILGPALLAGLLASRQGRAVLRRPVAWCGMLLAVVPGLPALWWNVERGFESFAFQLGHGFGAERSVEAYRTLLEFLAGQLLVITPLLFALLLWALLRAVRRFVARWPQGDPCRPVLLAPALLTLGVFASASVYGSPEANWAAPAYLTGFVLLAEPLGRLLRHARRAVRVFGVLALGLPLLVSAYLIAVAVLLPAGWGPVRIDDLRDRASLVAWVEGLRAADPARDVTLLASRHQLASLLAFRLSGRPALDVPLVRGSGSAYREWTSPVCANREAWYLSHIPASPALLNAVFETWRAAEVFEETLPSGAAKRTYAYRGLARATLCDQR